MCQNEKPAPDAFIDELELKASDPPSRFDDETFAISKPDLSRRWEILWDILLLRSLSVRLNVCLILFCFGKQSRLMDNDQSLPCQLTEGSRITKSSR